MRVLIADDERDMTEALGAILRREGYESDLTYNGVDALERALSLHYDCLILDVMMPGLSGLEVLTELRRQSARLPVLMLTAKSQPRDRVDGLNAGADDYLAKPFVLEEFTARVNALTRRSGASRPVQLQAGNLSLDRSTLCLSQGQASVRLNTREFRLLELFMSQPGQPIPAPRLSALLGEESAFPPDDTVLAAYIAYLRRKLAALGANLSIDGGPDRGYKLQPLP